MNATICTTPAEVRTFCESVSDSTTKNIVLLKAIEQTVNWLVRIQSSAKSDAGFAERASEIIKTCERVKSIDEDGTLCALIEETENGLERLHALLISKREFGRKAKELDEENKAAVVDEYTNAISAIADLHSLMSELRWAIGEHDADIEKPTGPAFSNSDDLSAYLKTL